MSGSLPSTVRYVKIGEGGQWWAASKARNEVHAGWTAVPHELLSSNNLATIEACIRDEYGSKRGATQDFNGLRTLLDTPSQHLWITFQEGSMWWCTVQDDIHLNPAGKSRDLGHFWLECDHPWSDRSLAGRALVMANLPGIVTKTAGYRATICEPAGAAEILRIVRDEQDPNVAAAAEARAAYERAVGILVARLREKDFELLIDLILSRSGWNRLARLGGATEGVDVEAENAALSEIAFVQVKSVANQAVLNDYLSRFGSRRDRYQRMIFAVHTPKGPLCAPDGQPVHIWTGDRIATLVVRLGLGDWLANRV